MSFRERSDDLKRHNIIRDKVFEFSKGLHYRNGLPSSSLVGRLPPHIVHDHILGKEHGLHVAKKQFKYPKVPYYVGELPNDSLYNEYVFSLFETGLHNFRLRLMIDDCYNIFDGLMPGYNQEYNQHSYFIYQSPMSKDALYNLVLRVDFDTPTIASIKVRLTKFQEHKIALLDETIHTIQYAKTLVRSHVYTIGSYAKHAPSRFVCKFSNGIGIDIFDATTAIDATKQITEDKGCFDVERFISLNKDHHDHDEAKNTILQSIALLQ